MSSKIAIITARGGSKRIPRKNIRDFCGKPIIQYSIEAALKSNVFDEVMVSTEDEEIKRIALECGAKVPFLRSDRTASDMAMTYEVLLEVIDEYKKIGQEFDYMCCIYPTAPFITAQKLKDAMDMIEKDDLDTVLPVVQFSFPPQRGFTLNDTGYVNFIHPENALVRSQDLAPVFHDAGQFYCMNVEQFSIYKKIIMDRTKPIIVDEMEVQDIDNEIDWKLAELKYNMMLEKNIG